MIVNNIPQPIVDFNAKHNRIDRQIEDIKRLDAFRSDEHNKQRLEKVDANIQANINYLRKKELEELNLYTASDKRQEYYDYKRLLFLGMNFDRYA
jgi:ribosomal protein S15P/S13E